MHNAQANINLTSIALLEIPGAIVNLNTFKSYDECLHDVHTITYSGSFYKLSGQNFTEFSHDGESKLL